MRHGAVAAAAALPGLVGRAPAMLSEEPAPGEIPHNEVVLVDDGSCPAGQVGEPTGGNTDLDLPRQRRCVSRP